MKWLIFFLCFIFSTSVCAQTVQDKTYDESISINGQTLKLIGAGVRQVWGMKIYIGGFYTQSGQCDVNEIINKEEVKYARLDILRNINAKTLMEYLNQAFGDNMPANPSPELVKLRAQAFSYFKGEDCKKGEFFEFIYVPGKGTTIKQHGKSLGATIPGEEWSHVFWRIYFSDQTCCPYLQEAVLNKCKGIIQDEPDWMKDVYSKM